MTPLHPASYVLLILVALTAGIYDIRFRRIPNWLVLAGFLSGFALNVYLYGLAGLAHSGLGFAVAFGLYLPLYLLRGMGAGDVKLMGALGAIVGWRYWMTLFIVTALLGGVIAVILMLFKGRARRTLWNVGYLVSEMAHFRAPHLKREELDIHSPQAMTLPHGTVIALAALLLAGVAVAAR